MAVSTARRPNQHRNVVRTLFEDRSTPSASNFYGRSGTFYGRSSDRSNGRSNDSSVRYVYSTLSGRSEHIFKYSQSQDNFRWLPGQTIPHGTDNAINPPRPTVAVPSQPSHDDMFVMMQQFQGSMVSQLEKVCSKLDNIDTRMVALETRQKSFEEASS